MGTVRSVTRRRRRIAWLGMALLVVMAVVLAGIFPYRQILAQERVVDLKRQQLEALESETDRLRREVELLQTPEEIERLARERFGFVRPGEKQYVVVWEEGEPEVELPAQPTLDVPREESGIWSRIWGFLTGADLEKGG